jgi:hypothetical protein
MSRLYETTRKWHGSLMIKLAAFQASSWAEQRTAEPLFKSFFFDQTGRSQPEARLM